MVRLVHELVNQHLDRSEDSVALRYQGRSLSYGELARQMGGFAALLRSQNLESLDRVAVYLPKCLENVAAMFGSSLAGCAFVPINPILKPRQVAHILEDSGARVLVTSRARLDALGGLPDLIRAVLVDEPEPGSGVLGWPAPAAYEASGQENSDPEALAALFYTSGSTGRPKGVALNHRNIVTGAISVSSYIGNTPDDRILSLLPLSFDAGFSQLTTAFACGARTVLLDYLLAGDVVRAMEQEQITGLTGVPPLWMQLVAAKWPPLAGSHLRYFANTGGKMPRDTLEKLRSLFPQAAPFLMYGLTEAFRSTYLPPSEVDKRPDSIGKAIPNVQVMVVREDGTECDPHEPGELVHRGPLVAMGYWKDEERTKQRFRPAPGQSGVENPEIAVWSGDVVVTDDDGFLYFVGRRDDMIKTSGYRVSPTEIEEAAFASGLVQEVAAVGLPDERLGQYIALVALDTGRSEALEPKLLDHLRQELPAYMVPRRILWRSDLPRNPNGKLDRRSIAEWAASAMNEVTA